MKKVAFVAALGLAVIAVGAGTVGAAELDLTQPVGTCSNTGGPSGMTCAAAGWDAAAGVFTTGGTTYYSFAGLLWSTTTTQPTGSGFIDSFVRIQDAGPDPENLVVDGMNTSGDLLNDEKPGPTFTHDVTMDQLKAYTITNPETGATETYYKFLLDINQEGGDPLLTLSGLQLCQSTTASLSYVDSCADPDVTAGSTFGTSELRYDLDRALTDPDLHPEDGSTTNRVLLDYKLNSGSGSGDLFVYVPSYLLPKTGDGSGDYLYLWSQFGLPLKEGASNNDGYEEWAFWNKGNGTDEFQPLPGVPEPATLVMLGTGLLLGSGAIRRRNRRQAVAKAAE